MIPKKILHSEGRENRRNSAKGINISKIMESEMHVSDLRDHEYIYLEKV